MGVDITQRLSTPITYLSMENAMIKLLEYLQQKGITATIKDERKVAVPVIKHEKKVRVPMLSMHIYNKIEFRKDLASIMSVGRVLQVEEISFRFVQTYGAKYPNYGKEQIAKILADAGSEINAQFVACKIGRYMRMR
jgi:hypothetical protein